MRRIFARTIGAFPFEGCSRRVLDETLLDWKTEADAAVAVGSVSWRGFVHVRAVVSLLRALVLIIGCEVRDLPKASFAARMAVVTTPIAVYFAWPSQFILYPESVPPRYWPELTAALVVPGVSILMPLGMFLVAATWPRRSALQSAAAIVGTAGAAIALLLLTPAANGHYRTVVRDVMTRDRNGPGSEPFGFVDRDPLDAIGLAFDSILSPQDHFPNAFLLVFLLASIPLAVAVWGLIGVCVRRCLGWRRIAWLTGLPILYVLQGLAMYPIRQHALSRSLFSDPLIASLVIAFGLYVVIPLALLRLAGRSARVSGRVSRLGSAPPGGPPGWSGRC